MKKIIVLGTFLAYASFYSYAGLSEYGRIRTMFDNAIQRFDTLDCKQKILHGSDSEKEECRSLQILIERLVTALNKFQHPWERELVGWEWDAPTYSKNDPEPSLIESAECKEEENEIPT